MACSLLLSKGELKLDSMPNLADTRFMSILLSSLGMKSRIENNIAYISGEPKHILQNMI